MNKPQSWLSEQARRRGISLPAPQVETLCRLAEIVFSKGILLGLSGRRSLKEILEKDILDSLLLVPHLRGTDALLDIGSGAGFPGIPLKIALPGLSLTLLEGKRKAIKFLKEVVQGLQLDIEIFQGRAEEGKNNPALKNRFDIVTGRAVAPLKRFLPWAAPFLKPRAKLLLQKGKKWEEELKEAVPTLKRFGLALESVLPGLEGDQKIVVLRKA